MHGYGIACRIKETSRQWIALNFGTLSLALLQVEQEEFIEGEWRPLENNGASSTTRSPERGVGTSRVKRATTDWRRWYGAWSASGRSTSTTGSYP